MPLRTLKRDTAEELTLEWILHIRNYKLTLNKDFCVGCQICTLACPKEAIELVKQPKTSGMKVEHATIDIDLEKCNFCGICDILCPYGAVKVTVNGEHLHQVVKKEGFQGYIIKHVEKFLKRENPAPRVVEEKDVDHMDFLRKQRERLQRLNGTGHEE